ncbi:MAG: DUF1015 domain-containing protein [Clostridiales bacterium]|nr:DUF1015 domain-containing protein [Clostridiales bacterium]
MIDFNDEILLPTGDVADFAAVACDQFAADPEYWNTRAAEMPPFSALDFILPECFLSDSEKRIAAIRRAAADVPSERFTKVHGAVYVTRKTCYGRVRHGVVASIDLFDYDYKPGSQTLVRASERTIEERIPPRVKIREAIDFEMPHIMLLVDDPDDLLMSACRNAKKRTVYDGELNGNGGHITGELIENTSALDIAVNKIIDSSVNKFGTRLFALVGDGNHSLATAKFCSLNNPTSLNQKALVEIVNIYDDGLVFEPIHRLVKTDSAKKFADGLRSAITGDSAATLYMPEPVTISVPSDKIEAITAIDRFCEDYVKGNGGYIEYVHGTDKLCQRGYVGIEMRGIQKSELFMYVVKNGVLPKKTFSLGEAEEKRYYIECRKIK